MVEFPGHYFHQPTHWWTLDCFKNDLILMEGFFQDVTLLCLPCGGGERQGNAHFMFTPRWIGGLLRPRLSNNLFVSCGGAIKSQHRHEVTFTRTRVNRRHTNLKWAVETSDTIVLLMRCCGFPSVNTAESLSAALQLCIPLNTRM